MHARRGENVYTDPSLLGVAGPLEAQPELRVEVGEKTGAAGRA